MRWVTFYYDLLRDRVFDLKVHDNKEIALEYFNTLVQRLLSNKHIIQSR